MTYKDITFIIPLRCESNDRVRNLYICLNWIKKQFNSPVIVKESNTTPMGESICKNFDNTKYIFEQTTDSVFHRTKLLNDMLDLCQTKFISNFDCDVILPKENVDLSLSYLNNGIDFVYPYSLGNYQKRIQNSDWTKFNKCLDLLSLNTDEWTSYYGHCFFAKTDIYKKAFGENENFYSYGPEDQERYFRFKKLGYSVTHLPEKHYVYHIEHTRTPNSCNNNPKFKHNLSLNNMLSLLNKEETIEHYKNLEYVKERKYT
jgi:hypothetical protein